MIPERFGDTIPASMTLQGGPLDAGYNPGHELLERVWRSGSDSKMSEGGDAEER